MDQRVHRFLIAINETALHQIPFGLDMDKYLKSDRLFDNFSREELRFFTVKFTFVFVKISYSQLLEPRHNFALFL